MKATRSSIQLWPSQTKLVNAFARANGCSFSDALRHIIGQWAVIQDLIDANMVSAELREMPPPKVDS